MERFGQVYVNDGLVEVPLKSACFSNLDWTWYNQVGEVHKDLKTYGDRLVSVGFLLHNKNKFEQIETHNVKFQLPYYLQDLPCGPSKEYFDFAKDMEIATAKELGIFDLYDKSNVASFMKCAGVTAFFCPSDGLLNHSRLQTYLRIISVIDDVFDTGDSEDSKLGRLSKVLKSMPFASLQPLSNEGLAILRGHNPSDLETLMTMKEASTFVASSGLGFKDLTTIRQYYNIGNGMLEGIRSEILKFANTPEDIDTFLQTFENMSRAGQIEICKEWKYDKDHALFREAQEELRASTCGMHALAEAVAIQLEIKLSTEIRSNFVFQRFCRDAASYIGKLNDILSYENESRNSDTAILNEVYILHNLEDFRLSEAFERVIADANKCARRVMTCENILLDFFQGDEQLKTYLSMVKKLMCGAFQASCFLDRYHTNITVNCFVHN